MRLLLLACLVIGSLAAPVKAQEAATKIEHYWLENGLEVVLAPDRHVPKVVLNVAYRVGSLNEPPGRSGFAHLFEHLMFAGTPAFPNIDVAYSALGVGLNAWTYEDQTLYYAEGLASTLPYMLSLEADRMANQGMAITAENLAIQRAVVLNEMRENVLDTPAGAGWEAFRSVLFPIGHPYHRPVLGSIPDLQAATIEDVHGFFATYYLPNNAILSLVGDFDVAAVKALIEQTFALVPRGADMPRPPAVEVPPARARLALEDAVPTPFVDMGWVLPASASPEIGALALAAELIGNWEYGLLRQTLMDEGLASDASAWIEDGLMASRFFIEVTAADGVEAGDVEAALRAALADFAKTPIDAGDLERSRRKLLQDQRLAVEPFKARAEELVLSAIALGRPEAAVEPDQRIARASAADVAAVVQRFLTLADASVMIIAPGPRGGYPDVLTKTSGQSQPFAVAAQAPVAIPALAAGEPVPGSLPARQVATLSNGLEIVHYQVPGASMAYVTAASNAGRTSVPPGREGMVELAAAMAPRGAGGRDFATFARAAKDIDADISQSADYRASFVSLSVPANNLSGGVALLADAVRQPLFDPDEWDSVMEETLYELEQRDEDLQDLARRVAEAQLFPTQPGAPANDRSIASVKTVTREETQAFYARLFSPASVTFYSVGPMDIDAVAAALETSFGDWQSAVAAPAPRPRPAAEFSDQQVVVFVPKPDASQSAIFVATPAPGLGEAGAAEALTVSRLLGEDFISRINAVIREAKGYSYGTDGGVYDSVRLGSLMSIEAPVERDHTGDALTDILAGYASLATQPVRPDEVARSSTDMLTKIAGTAETAQSLIDTIRAQLGIGSSLEEVHARRLAIAALDAGAVRREAERLSRLNRAVIVVVGDPETVLPQLEALGLVPTIVEADAI